MFLAFGSNSAFLFWDLPKLILLSAAFGAYHSGGPSPSPALVQQVTKAQDSPGKKLVVVDGRAVTADKSPLAGVKITAFEQPSTTKTPSWLHIQFPRKLDARSGSQAISGADGTFHLDFLIDANSFIGLIFEKADWAPSNRLWQAPTLTPLEIVMTPLRSISGRLVRYDGSPVENARIFLAADESRSSAVHSDAQGRFRLKVPLNSPGFVLAAQNGEPLQGWHFEQSTSDVTLKLVGRSERKESRPQIKNSLTIKQERELMERIALPMWQRALVTKNNDVIFDASRILATAAPYLVLDSDKYVDRMTAILTVLETDPDEALSLIEREPSEVIRLYTYWRALQRLPRDETQRGSQLTQQMIQCAKAHNDPERRAHFLCEAALYLTKVGNRKSAVDLLEGIRQFCEVSNEPQVKWRYAEALAALDPKRALAFHEKFSLQDQLDRDRSAARIAFRMAANAPELAQRIISNQRASWKAEIDRSQGTEFAQSYFVSFVSKKAAPSCFEMACSDVNRALQLANSGSNVGIAGYCQGLVALRLHDKDADRARQLLDQVYHSLLSEVTSQKPRSQFDSAIAPSAASAAALLPVVSVVDPGKLEEWKWLVLALLEPPSERGHFNGSHIQFHLYVAAMIGSFDKNLAWGLVEMTLQKIRQGSRLPDARVLGMAVAAANPKAAESLLADKQLFATEADATQFISGYCSLLSRRPAMRSLYAAMRAGYWRPEEELMYDFGLMW